MFQKSPSRITTIKTGVTGTAQNSLHVSSKHAIAKTGIAGPEAQRVIVAVGLVITLFMTIGHS